MSRSLPPNRAQSPQPCRSVRHAVDMGSAVRAAGAAAEPPAAAALPPVSAVAVPLPEPAPVPVAMAPVVAALTTIEGQAVFRMLSPGSIMFRAGNVFRFGRGSRGANGRQA